MGKNIEQTYKSMDRSTEQTSKLALCDIPNTLFDSRHRTNLATGEVYITDIKSDELNYTCLLTLRALANSGYSILLTHYCLHRLHNRVQELLDRHSFNFPYTLVTNWVSQEVCSNLTLKKHLLQHYDIDVIIDNSKEAEAHWLNNNCGLIQVPLPLKFSDELC